MEYKKFSGRKVYIVLAIFFTVWTLSGFVPFIYSMPIGAFALIYGGSFVGLIVWMIVHGRRAWERGER